MQKKIASALISVFNKEGLDDILEGLHKNGIRIYATGGSLSYIRSKGFEAIAVEHITGFPGILDGRVKTLHPAVFGGILARRSEPSHQQETEQYLIPLIDLVIVDLYPFSNTVASSASEQDIIEKIDIGGVALIRAAAKNFEDVVVIPSVYHYHILQSILADHAAQTDLALRRKLAHDAFSVTSSYDEQIAFWMMHGTSNELSLRYGENPHQKAWYKGDLSRAVTQLHGKDISYNNLLDLDAAVKLIREFDKPAVAVIKHNNPCGCACAADLRTAWELALAGDPVSAYGGIIISNQNIDVETATKMNEIFFEVLAAPGFDAEAMTVLKSKKNRILLKLLPFEQPAVLERSVLNGLLFQENNLHQESMENINTVTETLPSPAVSEDLLFAMKIVKHCKSNAIVIAKNRQLIGSGVGQTSRVDAVQQAIHKAKTNGFDLHDAVLASDAFFPFADSIVLASDAGIKNMIQPGGSIRDAEVIEEANRRDVAMVFTGYRHFKH